MIVWYKLGFDVQHSNNNMQDQKVITLNNSVQFSYCLGGLALLTYVP